MELFLYFLPVGHHVGGVCDVQRFVTEAVQLVGDGLMKGIDGIRNVEFLPQCGVAVVRYVRRGICDCTQLSIKPATQEGCRRKLDAKWCHPKGCTGHCACPPDSHAMHKTEHSPGSDGSMNFSLTSFSFPQTMPCVCQGTVPEMCAQVDNRAFDRDKSGAVVGLDLPMPFALLTDHVLLQSSVGSWPSHP